MTDEQRIKYSKTLVDVGLNWADLTDIINNELGTDYSVQEVHNRLDRQVKEYRESIRPILVFSDTHFPFAVEGYLDFLKSLDVRFNCRPRKKHLGDVVDNHFLSRHLSHTDAMDSLRELEKAKSNVHEMLDVFPEMDICLGNHDLIPQRQAATLGLGPTYVKSFAELYELPDTVRVSESFKEDGVLYVHGIGNGGQTGPARHATSAMMSVAQGHSHVYAGVTNIQGENLNVFGMNTGCLFDQDTYAAEYGKYHRMKPSIGAGVIFNNKAAIWIPFEI